MLANLFLSRGVAFGEKNFFLIYGGLSDHLAEGIGDKRRAPEFDAVAGRSFVANAVHRRYIDAVGDRVGALNGLPGVELRGAVLLFFAGMPADGGGIK